MLAQIAVRQTDTQTERVTNLWSPDAREATSTVRKSEQVCLFPFRECFREPSGRGSVAGGQQPPAGAPGLTPPAQHVTAADFSWRSELSLQPELMLVSG